MSSWRGHPSSALEFLETTDGSLWRAVNTRIAEGFPDAVSNSLVGVDHITQPQENLALNISWDFLKPQGGRSLSIKLKICISTACFIRISIHSQQRSLDKCEKCNGLARSMMHTERQGRLLYSSTRNNVTETGKGLKACACCCLTPCFCCLLAAALEPGARGGGLVG